MSDDTTAGDPLEPEGNHVGDHDGDLVSVPRRRRLLRWSLAAAAAAVVVVWAVVAARGLSRDPALIDSPLVGNPAPELTLPALDGAQVATGDYDGRVYVVNFWASWCVPCREEAPHLQRFWERHGPEVGLIGIVYQDDEDAARAFRDEFGLTFPQAMDPGGRAALDFGVFGIPETYVVDERGVVMAKLVGAVQEGTLEEVLAQVRAGETYTGTNGDDYRIRPDDG